MQEVRKAGFRLSKQTVEHELTDYPAKQDITLDHSYPFASNHLAAPLNGGNDTPGAIGDLGQVDAAVYASRNAFIDDAADQGAGRYRGDVARPYEIARIYKDGWQSQANVMRHHLLGPVLGNVVMIFFFLLAFEIRREARPDDNEELKALQLKCPQGEKLILSAVNTPDFFARTKAYQSSKVIVALDGDRIVGSTAIALRNAVVNGKISRIGYGF